MYQEIKQMAQRALSRLNNVLCRGVLNSITTGKVPTANVSLLDKETYEGIEFAQEWGFISSPPVDGNTELLVGFLGGQRDQGTVLKSFNRKSPSTKLTLQEGEAALYNKVTNTYVLLKADGTIEIKSDASISINTPEVKMTGKLSVDGDIIDNKTGAHANTHTIRDMRDIFNAHVHSGVSVGGANTQASTTTQ